MTLKGPDVTLKGLSGTEPALLRLPVLAGLRKESLTSLIPERQTDLVCAS